MARWQDVSREALKKGIEFFKKRRRSRTLWISGSSSIFGVLAFLILLTGVTHTNSGDLHCQEECVSFINITSTYWRVCFSGNFTLIDTNPEIPVDVYVPARGKGNWRLFNPEKDCIERKNKYNVLPNRFKIVGHKEKSQTVKWAYNLDSAFLSDNEDPVWIGEEDKRPTIVVKEFCENKTVGKRSICVYDGRMNVTIVNVRSKIIGYKGFWGKVVGKEIHFISNNDGAGKYATRCESGQSCIIIPNPRDLSKTIIKNSARYNIRGRKNIKEVMI